ncbi:MAG: Omp28-related outer membrane protein [Crocinitomicaceae bacterium]|nr:Omp28-related outer membrane protein [Crocinitomicaceae bacterium]
MKNLTLLLVVVSLQLTSINNSTAQQTVALVEQFTGFRCVWCPEAMVLMDSLENAYQDSVVFVNIHAGLFAEPSISGTNYLTDLRTSQGEEYMTFSQTFAIPSAMVSRQTTGNIVPNSFVYMRPEWDAAIDTVVNIPKPIDMILSATYSWPSNQLDIDLQSTLWIDHNGDYNVVYYLIEDDVIADQGFPNSTIDPAFSHQNVLRDVLNPTWGDPFMSGFTPTGSIINDHVSYTPNTAWNLSNCSVIAYVREISTERVIQVASISLDGIVGTDDVLADEPMYIMYPNPAVGEVTLSNLRTDVSSRISIVDNLGKVAIELSPMTIHSISIDISDLSKGVYQVLVEEESGRITSKKLIVQ